MPPLPRRQTPNKHNLRVIVSKFVMERFGIHKQCSLPAPTDLIQSKGNDKVKRLTHCAAGGRIGYLCLRASMIIQYKVYYWAFVAANRHLSFFVLSKLAWLQGFAYVILSTSNPKMFAHTWKHDREDELVSSVASHQCEFLRTGSGADAFICLKISLGEKKHFP